MSKSDTHPAGPKCPICKSPAVQDSRPFCSKRCKDIDLARWLGGGYAIAGGGGDSDEDGDGGAASHETHRGVKPETSADDDA